MLIINSAHDWAWVRFEGKSWEISLKSDAFRDFASWEKELLEIQAMTPEAFRVAYPECYELKPFLGSGLSLGGLLGLFLFAMIVSGGDTKK
jgi:hypothetical protein